MPLRVLVPDPGDLARRAARNVRDDLDLKVDLVLEPFLAHMLHYELANAIRREALAAQGRPIDHGAGGRPGLVARPGRPKIGGIYVFRR